MSKRPKISWSWLLMLALAAVLLYFAFRGVKWSDFISGLAAAISGGLGSRC